MDPVSGLQLSTRHNQSSALGRDAEQISGAEREAPCQTTRYRAFTSDTVNPVGEAAQAPQRRSRWVTFGRAVSYGVVAAAAIGGEHAGIAVNNAMRAARQPAAAAIGAVPGVRPPVANASETASPYVSYGNMQVHENLTEAFDEALSRMYKSRRMNETLAYLFEAPPNFRYTKLTIDPTPNVEGNSYNVSANRISWNPAAKYCIDDEMIGSKVISSATILMKQLLNAKDALMNLPAYLVRFGLGHPDFGNLQEKSAIDQTNFVNREIDGREIQNIDVELSRYSAVANSTLDAELPPYYVTGAGKQFVGASNSTFAVNAQRGGESGNVYDSRASTLAELRKIQVEFFTNAIESANWGGFLNSFNVSNLKKIESLMRDGEEIVLACGDAADNATLTAALDGPLKNYTAVAEKFAATLLDDAKDRYDAGYAGSNQTQFVFTPASEPFQMGAGANASLSRVEAEAPGTLEAQMAALNSTKTPVNGTKIP